MSYYDDLEASLSRNGFGPTRARVIRDHIRGIACAKATTDEDRYKSAVVAFSEKEDMRNRYEGPCYYCGTHVNGGMGHFERHKGSWRVIHAECVFKQREEKKNKNQSANRAQHEGSHMAKLELALLVGAESKQFLADLTTQIDRLEALQSKPQDTNAAAAEVTTKTTKSNKKAKDTPAAPEQEAATEATDDLGGDDDLFGEDTAAAPAKTTIEDVRKVVKDFAAKHGKAKALKVLEKFGVTSIPDIKPKDFDACIALCKKHM